MAAPFALGFAPTPRLGGALLVALAGGGACVATAAIPWWGSAAACLLGLALFVQAWRSHVTRRSGDAVTGLGADVEGGWWLATRSGGPRSVRFTGISVHRWAIVVTCRDDGGGRYALFVAPDAVSPEDYRRLSTRLRMHALASERDEAGPTPRAGWAQRP